MSEDFIDFEFRIDPDDASELSDYLLCRNPYTGRAFRSAIEAEYGPIPANVSLQDAFASARDTIVKAAKNKLVALEGEIDTPMSVIGPDICSF